MRVMFLCTANTGRSALAEALLRAQLHARGMSGVEIGSAGRLDAGVPSASIVVEVARRYGADLSAHRSTTVGPELLDRADLIVAMAAEHRAYALALLPATRPRTFLLRELARLVAAAGPRQPDETLADYLHRLDRARATDDGPGDRPGDDRDDVIDPYGHPVEVLWRTAAELDALLRRVGEGCWPVDRECPTAVGG